MILQKAALRPVPPYAIVDANTLHALELTLDENEAQLQEILDRAFGDMDRRQPTIAGWLSDSLAQTDDELVQSLGYFLIVTVYLAFREAFPVRLTEVDDNALEMASATLEIDEEIRAADPTEILDSDDILAMSQPSVLAYIQHHIDEALGQAEEEINIEELEHMYRSILIQVIALSHAVTSPSGELGPSPDMLA